MPRRTSGSGVLDPVGGHVDHRVEHQSAPGDACRRLVGPLAGVGAQRVVPEDRLVDDRVADGEVLPVEQPEPVGADQPVLVPRVAVHGGLRPGSSRRSTSAAERLDLVGQVGVQVLGDVALDDVEVRHEPLEPDLPEAVGGGRGWPRGDRPARRRRAAR